MSFLKKCLHINGHKEPKSYYLDEESGELMIRLGKYYYPKSQIVEDANKMMLEDMAIKYKVSDGWIGRVLQEFGIRKPYMKEKCNKVKSVALRVGTAWRLLIPTEFRRNFKEDSEFDVIYKEANGRKYLIYRLRE